MEIWLIIKFHRIRYVIKDKLNLSPVVKTDIKWKSFASRHCWTTTFNPNPNALFYHRFVYFEWDLHMANFSVHEFVFCHPTIKCGDLLA